MTAPEQPTPTLDEQIAAVKRFISASVSHADYYGPDNLHPDTAAMRAVLTTLEGAAQRAAEAVSEVARQHDEQVDRLKACEHIAEGIEGWEALRNICPSTAAVSALRDALGEADRSAESWRQQVAATPPPGDANDIRTLSDSSNRSAGIGVVESAAKTEAHSTSAPCGAATVEAAVSAVTPPGDAGERARACVNNFFGWFCGATNYEQIVAFVAAALQSERTAAASQDAASDAACHEHPDELGRAYAYLQRLLAIVAPQCNPAPDLLELCTQIDSVIVWMKEQAASQARRETLLESAEAMEALAEGQATAFERGACINCAKVLRALATPQESAS